MATLALLCALAGVLAFACAPAQAKTVHVFAGSFGSEGTGPGQFNEPRAIAVNDATHDVYVVDRQNNRVEEFNSTGSTLLREFDGSGAPTGVFSTPAQIAVDNSGDPLDPSNGDVYVVDHGHGVIDKFSETGVYLGQLTGTCEANEESPPCSKSKLIPFPAIGGGEESGISGLAVDSTGTLWVGVEEGSIYNFSDGLVNGYISSRITHFGTGIGAFAVDSEDNFYIKTAVHEAAKVTSAGGLLLLPFGFDEGEVVSGIAVDPVAGEVYIDNLTTIGAFTLGGSQIERFGSGHLPAESKYPSEASLGVAVDGADGTVYASDVAANDVSVFDAVTLPTVGLTALSEQTPRSVTLNGTVNPEGSPVTSCVFEYDTREYREGEAPHGASVPCSPGAGELVSAHLTGLTPEASYHYRLVAENAVHRPSETPDREFRAGPVLGGEFVTDVASESATLNASIDPNGDDTHYYFQYGASTSYGFEVPVAAPGVDLGSVAGVQSIGVHVQAHLAPGAVYHYRVVVLQGGEVFAEPDRTFTTQAVAGGPVLPDGRAWELVSPADKQGALIEQFADGVGDDIQAANDGSGVTYLTGGPAGEDPQGRVNWSQTLSERVPGGGGWRSEDLTLPRRFPGNGETATASALREEYGLFSSDLSLAAVEPLDVGTPPLSSAATERTVYLRDDAGAGSYVPLVTAGNVPPETTFGGANSAERMYFVAGTPDLSHALLYSPFALTPEAVFESSYTQHAQVNLYEWSAGRLQLVNVLPEAEGGEPTRGPQPQVRLAGGTTNEGFPSEVNPSALSSDGRRVAWTLGIPGHLAGASYKGLYVRDMVDQDTVKVSGPNGVFQWMSSDGSRVFFLEGGDLHECEIVEAAGGISCAYSDLTADYAAGESSGGVQELVSDVSRDGSYAYFVARGVLAGAPGAVSGGDNLYLLHDGGGVWSTSFIATLSPEDESSWYQEEEDLPDLSRISSRVSPDGRYLAFMSDRPLTGYDNTDAASAHADEEVYLYHAPVNPAGETGSLVCASCDPTGARPVGVFDEQEKPLLVDRGETWTGRHNAADAWLAGSIPGWDRAFGQGSQYQPRYLSDSGRLFFNSPDDLVPHATNGVEDVYEYEPEGLGSCATGSSSGNSVYEPARAFEVEGRTGESFAGCVGLISSGTSSQESAFFDASENGDDVFFITEARLVGADYDNAYDVYDAHVCGSEGVPCTAEPVSSPPCDSGDSCKAAPSPQPEIFGPAPSATFTGAGNALEEPAKPAAKTKAKPLTRAQRLTKALKVCGRDRSKKKRADCQAQARRRYGVTKNRK